ncbi:MAG: hypothetical protein ACLSA0_30710 [Eisenbergiella massiliensis]
MGNLKGVKAPEQKIVPDYPQIRRVQSGIKQYQLLFHGESGGKYILMASIAGAA